MIYPRDIRINRQFQPSPEDHYADRWRVVEGGEMVFSWALDADDSSARQKAFRVTVTDENDTLLHDSGWIETASQEHRLTETGWPRGEELTVTVALQSGQGDICEKDASFFLGDVEWTAPWIAANEDIGEAALYLRKEFILTRPVRTATLYACGLGYHKLYLNSDLPLDGSFLDPAATDYTRVCQYVVLPDIGEELKLGHNCLRAVIGGGWRRTIAHSAQNAKPRFYGDKQFSAMLVIQYEDGSGQTIVTDESWTWSYGPITSCSVFQGTTYDARLEYHGRQYPDYTGEKRPVVIADAPGGKMRPMLIPPIVSREDFFPVSISEPVKGKWIVDFGQNIAGVVRLDIPELPEGSVVTVRHAEILDEDGTLYTAPLRKAACTDTYISDGEGSYWIPQFTYHGFRYAEITGFRPTRESVAAMQLCTGLDKYTSFRCGSAILNAIHQNALMTERDNMHSILTDCPQRDERMGWMNDATVRFEETPFNFETGAMFRKIVRDITAGQREDGAISCTVPYAVFGSFPADPVCSSYLVAAWQNYLHVGDLETIQENFEGFAAWENCLLEHSDEYIVNYSYYGDWAGPAYACEPNDGARSIVTPGIFMSTGYSYYNCTLLAKFARLLNRELTARKYDELAGRIKKAMLDKWYDPATAKMATGSQACQAFALWLKIIPESDRARAARLMRDDLIARDYRFTTGNLCTRYLLDMLTEYGYVDEAYQLMTREDYPSFGYMIQQEATTIWERFELKKSPGMNSHNHPMYGAADAWFFTGLLGIKPEGPAFETLTIKPSLPAKLMSAQGNLDTARGSINVRWVKRYGGAHLYVDLPIGVTARVIFGSQERTLTGGSHHLETPVEQI